MSLLLDVFEDLDNIEFGGYILSNDFVFDLIQSKSPVDDYAVYYIQEEGIPAAAIGNVKGQLRNTFPSNTEFKGALFAALFNAETKEDSLFLFKEYKEDNIIIYPETMLFRTIKKIPFFLIKRFVKNQNGTIE